MKKTVLMLSMACILVLMLAGIAFAQEEMTVAQLSEKLAEQSMLLNTVWVLVAAFLVFWMQAGFAYVEAGLTRAKNTNNIMMKNLVDFCFGTIAFWVIGFGLMFGAGSGFTGREGFFLIEKTKDTFASLAWTDVSLYTKFMFQLVFAATAATIVSGAMAERTKFKSYLVYSVAISAFIYPVVGHWIWGGGWLAGLGMWDFAGSTVVHSVGGWLALTGAVVLGPRVGKYKPNGKANAIPGHNLPMAALGVFILWLGWFGFNPGSTMAAVNNIGHIAVTTNMAAAVGALTAMLTAWIVFGKPDVSMSLNGVLAGLVAITASCAFVSPLSALIIGAIAGVLVVLAVIAIEKIHIDDPVGAIAVHCVNGVFGTLAVGLFAQDQFMPGTTGNGLLFGGGMKLLTAQSIGVLAVAGWSLATGFGLFYAIKAIMGLRVTVEEELEGLDIGEHGMSAYPDFEIVGIGSHSSPPSAPTGSSIKNRAPILIPQPREE